MRFKKKKKREQTPTLNFLSVFSCSNVLVCWFHLHRFVSGVRPLLRAHPKIGAVIFVCLYIFVAGVQLLFLSLPVWLLIHFETWVVPHFCLVSERGHICFWWFHTCAEYFGPSGFFLVIFSSCSHSPTTGWPTTSVLAWFTVDSYFLYSLSPSQEISL